MLQRSCLLLVGLAIIDAVTRKARRPFDHVAIARGLLSQAVRVLETAKSKQHILGATSAIREARSCVELLARLAGELAENNTVNVFVSPEWTQLRAVLIEALAPHPEARLAVAEALQRVETREEKTA